MNKVLNKVLNKQSSCLRSEKIKEAHIAQVFWTYCKMEQPDIIFLSISYILYSPPWCSCVLRFHVSSSHVTDWIGPICPCGIRPWISTMIFRFCYLHLGRLVNGNLIPFVMLSRIMLSDKAIIPGHCLHCINIYYTVPYCGCSLIIRRQYVIPRPLKFWIHLHLHLFVSFITSCVRVCIYVVCVRESVRALVVCVNSLCYFGWWRWIPSKCVSIRRLTF